MANHVGLVAFLATVTFVTAGVPANAPKCSGTVNQKYQGLTDFLTNGLDESFDPCTDFYSFTCNKYLQAEKPKLKDVPRFGTYDQGQTAVNLAIYNYLQTATLTSKTEQITKKIVDACVANAKSGENKATLLYNHITTKLGFGEVPFFVGDSWSQVGKDVVWNAVGKIERHHAVGTLMSTIVTVDYKNVTQNAMYIGQPQLSLPRDYYVKPQYLSKILGRVQDVKDLMALFALDNKKSVSGAVLQKAAQDVVNFEIQIALASWPDDLLRNYQLQYNAYKLKKIATSYKDIQFDKYVNMLLSDGTAPVVDPQAVTLILTQPSYFTWLNSVFEGDLVDEGTIVNYMLIQLLSDSADFLGGDYVTKAEEMEYIPYVRRQGRGLKNIGSQQEVRKTNDVADNCVGMLQNYMPYGPGYTYVKSRTDRAAVVADVKRQTELVITSFIGMIGTLKWISPESRDRAYNKAHNLVKNYGWPAWFGDFVDSSVVDAYHSDYASVLSKSDYWEILMTIKGGMELKEFFRALNYSNDRLNFLASPATVNAWYQPERNSITFPFAVFNPPYYNFNWPQAFNYGGQGGTGGHELTHGYDDEGVQFGPDGTLIDCDTFHCGWMDFNSTEGFIDMAQCVVSQFNSQCCPLKTGNVHCANGATTQGENIADLGGQQAAHAAYRSFIKLFKGGKEEDCLPGAMSKYTPNQIFWISYGYSWCMAQTDDSLVKQMLTNPHAPAQCRTNQVMQDIPEFGVDFGCPRGSKMYPQEADRCKVWVGQ